MKKFLLGLACVLLLVGGVGYLLREQLWQQVQSVLTSDMFVAADTDNFDPGLPVGTTLPPVRALYQGREEITDVRRFVAEKGMVLVANRSADWCPYCMAQYVQLQGHLDEFRAAGIAVLALTYDTPQLQQKFIDKHAIGYPFLSDVDAYTVKALGILNEDHQPGDWNYGIPHPGVFVLTPELEIVGKIFVDGYEKRVSAEAVLAYAAQLLNQ